ncbi:hypothetical protein F8O01_12590 [Pseudoclavibacter chungangensis]|uniref:EcsC family protein n=1 Tax=Pseudoclavibacter chungangensis TaxID=587635 RepID=A0A7J5BPJ6_9MICO|nr:hypothetical protein [Pseudoclavibacter chungangensis]KAB1655090.1 hypothetical protein F8O01_12590 [Pseudoclavibacter chungangensis]NYJ66141.1 hypothetical protein [Pseudoclavibacter chungangensis]
MSRTSRHSDPTSGHHEIVVVPTTSPEGDPSDAPAPLPPRIDSEVQVDPTVFERALDRVLAIQRPLVLARIRALRRRHPQDTPAELIARLETQYLNTVMATGGGAGAAAVVPGIGTAAALTVSGVETIGFLEVSALYGQAISEIHGLPVSDPVRARTLVQSLILGEAAKNLVKQFAAQAGGKGVGRQQFWGEIVTRSLPSVFVGELSQRIQRVFLRRFAATSTASTVGRLVPFGIGALIGGAGNRILGRQVVRASREAFGPAPSSFPMDLHPDVAVRGVPETDETLRGGRFFFLPRGRSRRALERGSGSSRRGRGTRPDPSTTDADDH